MTNVLTRTLLTCLFCTVSIYTQAQKFVEFRTSEVSTNLDDMDGFGAGDSDPMWCYEILDTTFNLSGYNDVEYTGNCLGTETPLDVFYSESYSGNLPDAYLFRWRAYENDVVLLGGFNNTLCDAATLIDSVIIDASLIDEGQFNWSTLATFSDTATGISCDTMPLMYSITLQYRVLGGVSVDKTQSADSFEATLIPNPVLDYATLHLSGLKDYSNIDIQLFDMTGRKVQALNNQNSDRIPLKVDDLDKGVYVLRVLQEGRSVGVLKMVVR